MNRKTQKKFIYFLFFIALISNAFPVWSAPYNYEEQRDSEEDYWDSYSAENTTHHKQRELSPFLIIYIIFIAWLGREIYKDYDNRGLF